MSRTLMKMSKSLRVRIMRSRIRTIICFSLIILVLRIALFLQK